MFGPTSRYVTLETVSLEREGRTIAYKRRRFLPFADDMPPLTETTVADGERLDLICARTLGDPEQFWRICDANNAMNPSDLEETGRLLRVAMPQA
jgi:hypothetical protein